MVDEMIEGFVLANSEIVRLERKRIIVRSQAKPRDKVGLVIGNGTGHEPANLGFVGNGMLDVNVCGDFFSAPAGSQLAEGIRIAARGKGAVLFVANHSGDVLNARIAQKELAQEDIMMKEVLLTDDISTAPMSDMKLRRGRGGALFAFKIAGALAEETSDLNSVASLAERVIRNTRTLGVTIKPYTNLETGKLVYEIPQNLVEIGTGSHGEGGREQQTFTNTDDLVRLITERLIKDAPENTEEEVLCLVSGSGSTSLMELYIVNRTLHQVLSENSIRVFSTLVGNYVTTHDMTGFFVSICWADEEMKERWLEPCRTPHFHIA